MRTEFPNWIGYTLDHTILLRLDNTKQSYDALHPA